ncbi:MAG: 4-(cytidine 5'-diphospho)-2-C-methyl-D-erythritol kinase [Rhizobiaceae bacterium]
MSTHTHWQAPAKVNLALHVVGQKSDGYHQLDTLVTFAKIGDQIKIAPARDLTFVITGAEHGDLKMDADNLVCRAAHLLRDYVHDDSLGAKITLEKNLPIASGIGGGSADAAATLLGLMDYWQVNVGQHSLIEMALELGADVPMCLNGIPARVRGIGEEIEPVPLPAFPIVLANPRIGVSTPRIFKALDNKQNPPLTDPADTTNWIDYLALQRNDLQAPAISLTPAIADCLTALDQSTDCRLARMSGSGATCFGLYDTKNNADEAAAMLRKQHPDWWVVSTSTIV